MKRLVTGFVAVLLLAGTAWAGGAQRPPIVAPTDGETALFDQSVGTGEVLRAIGPGMQAGADEIIADQCPNGGWNWPHGGCSATYNNITGPICLGLMHAYASTGDPDHKAAAVAGGNYDLTSVYGNGEARFGTSAPYFLWQLSALTGNAAYSTHAETKFFDELSGGTYGPSNYDTAGWIASVQAGRTGPWINLRSWEFENIIPTAAAIGNAGQDTLFTNACRDGLDTLDNTAPATVYSDLIGLAGGVRGLAFAGATSFTAISSTNHAGINGISTLVALADQLASYQNADGSWYWHSNLGLLGGATESDKDTQTTAYAILALLEADPLVASDYAVQIAKGRDWLRSMQRADGGFLSYPGGGQNIEVEAEALNALAPDGCTQNKLVFEVPAASLCVKSGDMVTVELWQRALTTPVRGFQAWAQFDSTAMAFSSGTYTASPYGLPVISPITASGDNIDMAAGINNFGGQTPTQADALLVTLTFDTTGKPEGATTVSFRYRDPPSRFTKADGTELTPCLVQSPTILIDDTNPVINCPANVTVECDESTAPANTGGPATATDNLDDSPAISYTDVWAPNTGCTYTGTITRTWKAEDCAGNVSTCVQVITVNDVTAPTITCPPDITVSNDLGLCSALVNVYGGLLMTFDTNPVLGSTQAPGVWSPARYPPFGFVSAAFGGDNRLMHSIAAADAQSSGFYNTQGRKYDTPGSTYMEIDLYVPADWGTSGRRMAGLWGTAFDGLNAVSAYPIIEFTSEAPTPRFRTFDYNFGGWFDLGLPTGFAYDNWYTLQIALVGSTLQCTVGDLQYVHTVTNGSVQLANVILQGPNTTTGVTYDIYWDNFLYEVRPLAVDNCDPTPAVAGVRSDLLALTAPYPVGTTTVTWTATDACGNPAQCVQTIIVNDTENPVIACPPDKTVECDASTAPANTGTATATDNCGVQSITYADVDNRTGCNGTGTITRTWTATDIYGNAAQCVQTITVVDTTPPVITGCPSNITQSNDAGACGAFITWIEPSAGDNCSTPTVVRTAGSAPGSFFAVGGPYTITYTATDGCGLQSVCSFTVTVTDNEKPVITGCPSNITVPADAGDCDALVSWTAPTASDNCGILSFASDWEPGDTFPGGTTTVTYTATDVHGNVETCSFTVTVTNSNELVVSVDLEWSFTGTRCITFELWDCGSPVYGPVQIKQVLSFTSGSALNAVVLVPCDVYTCITARDDLHTLRTTVAPSVVGTQYIAGFTGGDQLLGGNLNDDFWVDILDFGVYSWQYNTNYGSGNTTCSTAYPHADISGDGLVGSGDFTFIQINFLKGHEANCCGMAGLRGGEEGAGPITEISVAELRQMGLGHLASGDLNRDGWLDEADVAAFMMGARPTPTRTATPEVIDAQDLQEVNVRPTMYDTE